MGNNIRSELFFLKQFGYSSTLLEYIFLSKQNPLHFIFEYDGYSDNEKVIFTKKDLKLSSDKNKYEKFKLDLFKKEFLLKKDINKIYFKYDDTYLSGLLPNEIQPLFMYSKGDMSLLSNKFKRISVVGTRNPREESVAATNFFVKKCVEKRYVIVSGLAEGIDSIAHQATLDYDGKTIAILPTNFNNIYPKGNQVLANKIKQKGLLLTSIGPNENTYKSSFLERNQYVANLSDTVLVIETNLRSGTMNTIRNASMSNKKIIFIDQKNNEINKKIIEFGGVMIDGEKINNHL